MAVAVQATTTSQTALAAPSVTRGVLVQNLGPEAIWVDLDGDATTTGSWQVPSGGSLAFVQGPGMAVRVRSTSAAQVSPADTRIGVTG